MWILKLHFSISVLCLITFIGFGEVYIERLKANGWKDGKDKKKGIAACLIFFVPIMNIIAVLVMFLMIGMKKSDFDKIVDESKKKIKEGE